MTAAADGPELVALGNGRLPPPPRRAWFLPLAGVGFCLSAAAVQRLRTAWAHLDAPDPAADGAEA